MPSTGPPQALNTHSATAEAATSLPSHPGLFWMLNIESYIATNKFSVSYPANNNILYNRLTAT